VRLLGIYVLSYLSTCQGAIAHFHEVKASFLHTSKANATSIKKKGNVGRDNNEKGMKCVNGLCYMSRGGGDEYDDDYDEEEEKLPPPPRKRPPSRQQSQARRQPPPTTATRRGPPPSRKVPPPSRRSVPPQQPHRHRRRHHSPSVLSSVAGLAKKTVDLTASATVSTLKGSGKAALYLVSPKHVTRQEVWGVWRLDQQRKSIFLV
jgi:hypothetical protein